MTASLPDLHAAARSQARTALLHRGLWSTRHLLGAARLGARWSLRPDGTAPDPMAIAWYLTHACPEACEFCNVSRALAAETPHLALPRAIALVDRLVPRIPVVALGGGEPMAYPHILDLVAHIHSRGARVFLVTAGTTMGPTRARELCRQAPAVLMVSLLGDEATHDRRMGRPGAFRRAVMAIEEIQRHRDPRRTHLVLNCTIGPAERQVLEPVARLARDLGVDMLRFSWLSFMRPREAALTPIATPYLVLPDEEVDAFDWAGLRDEVRRIERVHGDRVQFTPRLDDDELQAWFAGSGLRRGCLSLWHTLFLRPDGQAVPCGHMQEDPIADATSAPLDGWWNREDLRALRMKQRQEAFAMCARCCKV